MAVLNSNLGCYEWNSTLGKIMLLFIYCQNNLAFGSSWFCNTMERIKLVHSFTFHSWSDFSSSNFKINGEKLRYDS